MDDDTASSRYTAAGYRRQRVLAWFSRGEQREKFQYFDNPDSVGSARGAPHELGPPDSTQLYWQH